MSMYYDTDESKEGTKAFLEKRPPDFSKYRSHP
jgi:2-ketocyclohexanecarboxyl-CoA hydrolase